MLKAVINRLRRAMPGRRVQVGRRSEDRRLTGRVVVATRLYAPEPTPAAFRHEALVDELRRRGHRVRVLTSSLPRSVPVQDDSDVSRWPVLRDSQGHVKGYASYMSFDIPLILRLLAVRSPRVFVVEPPPTTGFAVMLVSLIRRVPYVYYAADVWADASRTLQGVPGIVPAVLGIVERMVWRRAALILAISPGVQQRIHELIGQRSAIAMVGNGIRMNGYTIEGPERGSAGSPRFIYAGTVSEWHGAGIFIDAFMAVVAKHPHARLIFFSEGAHKSALEQKVARAGIAGVEFHSRVPTEELSRHLRSAVASLASVAPGQGYDFAIPTKIYASTASGTPVIYAGTGPSVGMVQDGGLGWAVDYTTDAVAEAMLMAIAARADGTAPSPSTLREWTAEHASLEASAAQIVDLLEAVERGDAAS
ncbi:glycosyltransferase family 4 protein [Brachybacterium sp. p3-SID957]|uniref:glycosyltransferase family 4 protein n=1 Tax=Brachybacterium sp. p3-SID957 TaxID=2916049 RepID=UPI00223B2412|nr:glycosyltransferase family 4 protein [Brachybacterium sp. p3-SID957]MCT1775058.1 glycosyltransferase family 4 protein [Brachybacterium sp. p3-SID957]